MAMSTFAKTGQLSKFILRLDRIRIPLWLFGLTVFTLMVPVSFMDLYDSQQERDGIATTMENPAMTVMVGPGDLGNYTIGAMTAHQMLLLTAVVAGLMSIFLVTRHTRADEEDGRLELIRSLPAGRLSYLNATLLVLVGASLAIALINGLGLYALGIESMDLEGSLLYGTVLGATALFFAGVTALFAQLTESSRGTMGFSIGILLMAYLVRGVTDVSNDAWSWISPLGWVTKAEVYSSNNWWPVLLMIGVSVVLFVVANYLNAIRDLERGFFPSRPGRRDASRFLQSPLGLALRLQRTAVISWAVAIFVTGISYGAVLGDLESFFETNELMMQMLSDVEGASLAEQFLPMLMMVIMLLATVPPVMAVNRLRGEERKGRLEHLLAKAVSRTRLMGAYIIIAVVNGFVMLTLAALGLWSAAEVAMEEGIAFGTIYHAALAYYPALLVMVSLAVFLTGVLPRLTGLVWLYLLYSLIVLYLGGLFQFPDWMGQLSPFGHIPEVPLEDVAFMPMFILSLIVLVLAIAGIVGYNKRDMETS